MDSIQEHDGMTELGAGWDDVGCFTTYNNPQSPSSQRLGSTSTKPTFILRLAGAHGIKRPAISRLHFCASK